MIRAFKCKKTADLFSNKFVKRFSSVSKSARIKLKLLHAATNLQDLRIPPGNRLESLSGDRQGQHSIRINDQWRVCFIWNDGNAYDVEIVDYH